MRPKLCECGCGEPVAVSRENNVAYGWVKGEPKRFVHGHNGRKPLCYDVDPTTGCWIWAGAKTEMGYGTFRRDNVRHGAHRYFYEQTNGPIPKGLHLDHLCRNPSCVNPAHLEAVTPTENTRRGKSAKLTLEQAREIRGSSDRVANLAARFGVSKALISGIRCGRKWREAA